MLKRIIPVLLLSNRGLIKTQQFQDPKYIGDPINAVKIFSEKEVDELVFLDIHASKRNQDPDFDLIKDIASESYMPFSYGGGIKSLSQAEKILKNGAEKIIINNSFLFNHALASEMISAFGSSSVVACIDVKKNILGKYKVYSHVQEKSIDKDLKDCLEMSENIGFGEVIVQSVDFDGCMRGYDKNLILKVRESISAPLVALGGAGSLEDIRDILNAGADAAAAGSLFTFYGKYRAVLITYPEYKEIRELLK